MLGDGVLAIGGHIADRDIAGGGLGDRDVIVAGGTGDDEAQGGMRGEKLRGNQGMDEDREGPGVGRGLLDGREEEEFVPGAELGLEEFLLLALRLDKADFHNLNLAEGPAAVEEKGPKF